MDTLRINSIPIPMTFPGHPIHNASSLLFTISEPVSIPCRGFMTIYIHLINMLYLFQFVSLIIYKLQRV